MRIVAARLNHETNTFSPVTTSLESFGPLHNHEALTFGQGSNTAFGAFIDYATSIGAELATPLAATANPSGPCSAGDFEALVAAILGSVAQGCDAILLDLHGAMVSKCNDDCEGELLARLRTVAPEIPIGVALDLHGNITPRMVENCDCIVGFKTYPHIDMYETGRHVTRIVDAMLNGGPKPRMGYVHPPMLAHTLKMNTQTDCAMTDLVAQARAAEARPEILAATVFGGFPIADIAYAGVAMVTVAADQHSADELAEELANEAWGRRAEFVYEEEPLTVSLERAVQIAEQPPCDAPVVLLDHGDNCMSGGGCDTMDVLQAALEKGLTGIIAGPISDPEVVAELWDCVLGDRVSISLGNKLAAVDFVRPGPPVSLTGKLLYRGPGSYVVAGPIYTGQICDMGRTVVVQTDQAKVLITEEPHEPWDLGVFNCAKINPVEARFLILKSRMYCRPVFEPLAKGVIECASPGITSSNYSLFSFNRVNKFTYPLDSEVVWTT